MSEKIHLKIDDKKPEQEDSCREIFKILDATFMEHRESFIQIFRTMVSSLEEAEDIVHQGYVNARKNIDETKKGPVDATGMRKFLFRIMKNLVFNRNRDKKRRAGILAASFGREDSPLLSQRYPSPDRAAWRNRVGHLLVRALDKLPEKSRKTFLGVMDGDSYEERAVFDGINTTTVGSRTTRMKQELRKALDGTDAADVQ